MKTLKKIFAICVIGTLTLGALAGCSTTYSQDEMTKMITDAKTEANKAGYDAGKDVGINSVNVDSAVEKAIEDYKKSDEVVNSDKIADDTADKLEESDAEIERLKTVLEDYELAEQEVATEILSLEGSELIELNVGDSFGANLYDDNDVEKLLDTSIKFDGDNYDVYEEIETTSDLQVGYSLVDDEEFASEPYIMTTDDGAIRYNYIFDDVIDIRDISRDEPLVIKFLGEDLTITEIDSTEFEIRVGDSKWLDVGNSLTIGDTVIKAIAVTEDGDSAGIEIDGETYWIDEGDDLELDSLTIAIEDIKVIHSEGSDASIKLTVADTEDVYQTFEIGDSVVYDEDEDDAEFVYDLNVAGNDLVSISVEHNQKMDELDDDFVPFKEGESIVFPNEYFSLKYHSTNVEDYNKITMEFDDVEDEAGNEYNGVIFNGEDKDSFEIAGEETDEIYAWTTDNGVTWTLSYIDEDDDVIDTTDTTFKVIYEDTEYVASYDGNLAKIGLLSIDLAVSGGEFTHLGTVEEDAEATDVQYNLVNIGTRDDDVLGLDGIIIVEPENNSDNDVVEFLVPEDELELTTYLG